MANVVVQAAAATPNVVKVIQAGIAASAVVQSTETRGTITLNAATDVDSSSASNNSLLIWNSGVSRYEVKQSPHITITAGSGLAKSGDTLSVNTGTGITVTSDNVVIDTAWAGQVAITTVGTIGTGTWNGTVISATKGGTGASTFTSNGILYGNGAGTIQATVAGTDGYFLKSNSGTPAWTNVIDGGTF